MAPKTVWSDYSASEWDKYGTGETPAAVVKASDLLIPAKVVEVFKEWDTDGNGTLSLQEFRDVLEAIGIEKKVCLMLFKEADVNNDKALQYTELLTWLYKSPQEVKDGEVVAAFALVKEFIEHRRRGNIDEAAAYLGANVEWQAVTGEDLCGIDACKALFLKQKEKGLVRRGTSDWKLVPDGPHVEPTRFTLERNLLIACPKGTTGGCGHFKQSVTVFDGSITKVTHSKEIKLRESGLKAEELLRRFAVLRVDGMHSEAAMCLHEECEWTTFVKPSFFFSDNIPEPLVKGRANIERMWAEFRSQGVQRTPVSPWKSSPSLGGNWYERYQKLTSAQGEEHIMKQLARVDDALIVEVKMETDVPDAPN